MPNATTRPCEMADNFEVRASALLNNLPVLIDNLTRSAFDRDVDHVLDKNVELYRRLAESDRASNDAV